MRITTMNGGPNPVIVGFHLAADAQSGPGASQREPGTSDGNNGGSANREPESGTATGNQTGGVENSSNGGLAAVFQGGPEAGRERAPGTDASNGADSANRGPDRAGQPKGNHQAEQSNDSITLPTWASQLSKKITSDPASVAKLSSFKGLDEFVQASLETEASFALPGEKSSQEEIQTFYERLGKPKEAAAYAFAKSDPGFARIAFDTNLSSVQADALYKASLAQLDDARNGIKASLATDFEAADVLLQKEYGDKYDEAIALMGRGLGNNPKTGELSPIAKSLCDAGLAGKPEIIRAFIELGRATSEGKAAGGSSGTARPDSIMTGRGFEYKDNY